MDNIKKILGILWIGVALVSAYLSIVVLGIPKVFSHSVEDKVFGIIILFVLTPIIVGGFAIFGYYCLKGEYDNPE
ncbi:MAG: hypothetical protein LBQ84_05090 [Flavobacteriaceae bacterium]|jgi:hypothetical protein|nr:hypothetical protein [Flavobacteriaceae bacterium]